MADVLRKSNMNETQIECVDNTLLSDMTMSINQRLTKHLNLSQQYIYYVKLTIISTQSVMIQSPQVKPL